MLLLEAKLYLGGRLSDTRKYPKKKFWEKGYTTNNIEAFQKYLKPYQELEDTPLLQEIGGTACTPVHWNYSGGGPTSRARLPLTLNRNGCNMEVMTTHTNLCAGPYAISI